MDALASRGYITACYLLGLRGDELVQAVPSTVQPANAALVSALTSDDRELRARGLASGLRELTSELEERAVSA